MRDMTLKLLRYFYMMMMGKPPGRYFHVRSPYYQAAECNQKISIPVSLRWQVRFKKAKKGLELTLITATISVHLSMPVSTDLTIKSDSVLTNPIGKDGRCSKTSTTWCMFIVIYLFQKDVFSKWWNWQFIGSRNENFLRCLARMGRPLQIFLNFSPLSLQSSGGISVSFLKIKTVKNP